MNKITFFTFTVCLSLLIGINPLFSQDENASSSWKQEMQAILGVDQTGKADRETYDALYVFLLAKEIDEPELAASFDEMGTLRFSVYLDNNQERLMEMLTRIDEVAEEDALEDEIDEAFLDEEEFEEDFDVDPPWYSGLLRSVGLNLGFYKPSMAYWNDSYGNSPQHPNSAWTASTPFGMSFLGQADVRINLNPEKTLWTILQIGSWSGSAEWKGLKGDGTNGIEKIEYKLMPINLSVAYSLSDIVFPGVYVGAGLGANKITITQTQDSETPLINSGYGSMYHLIAGYDRPLTDQLSLGAELHFALGSHKHKIRGSEIVTKDISLTGPQILLQLNYVFPSNEEDIFENELGEEELLEE